MRAARLVVEQPWRSGGDSGGTASRSGYYSERFFLEPFILGDVIGFQFSQREAWRLRLASRTLLAFPAAEQFTTPPHDAVNLTRLSFASERAQMVETVIAAKTV